nr:MAG TPA: hypothetical protein [Caudoviricetes sp.]
MITAGLLVLIALLICIVTQLDGRVSSDEAQIYALLKEVERLTEDMGRLKKNERLWSRSLVDEKNRKR